jgi:hypothetical protein
MRHSLEGRNRYLGDCRVTTDLGNVSEGPMRGFRLEEARASCVSY